MTTLRVAAYWIAAVTCVCLLLVAAVIAWPFVRTPRTYR